MKKISLNLLRLVCASVMILQLASCEVEFSPNADWKNVPVVYCVLDQDDDTSWVRVERCYLSSDGAFSYGDNPDSITYREGEISVAILGYEGDVLRDSIPFHYTLRQRDSGAFAGGMMPVYYAETRDLLKEKYTYYLNVRDASGRVIASSTGVHLIHRLKNDDGSFKTLITDPTSQGYGFEFPSGYCKIAWNNLGNARVYQPVVRFYYIVGDETRYVDLKCQKNSPQPTSNSGMISYPRSVFLNDLKALLRDDTASHKKYAKRVDIYLTCCSEELNAYMQSAGNGSSVEQSREVYTNIQGGIGVFASRRTHLYTRLPSSESMVANVGLYWYLREQVGLE